MQVIKAKRILKEYHDNNYNASKALVQAGYKHTTATRKSKGIISEALKVAVQNDINEVVESSTMSPRNKILAMLNITEGDVYREFLKIVNQDKDLTNKLKALQPLLATQGIKWNEEQQNISPTLNLTVKANNIDNIVKPIVQDVGNQVIDSNEMAQQSGENNNVAQYVLLANEDKPLNSDDDVGDNTIAGDDVAIEKVAGDDDGGGVDLSFIGVKEGESLAPKIVDPSTIDKI
jgi:2-hydroxy-3-keto-5-methylthiopentenyl-1-phosphate phosphatase